MSDYNCNALRSITVSDGLKQKLLSIPATAKHQKKPAVIPIRYVMAAVSMALVFTLSISAIYLFGNKTNPVVPSPTTKETAAAKENEHTDASVSETEESSVSSTAPATQPSSQPPTQIATDSEGRLIITTITEIITQYGTEPAEPAEPDTPASPADQTEQPDQPSGHPTEQATASPEPQTDPPYYPTPTEKGVYIEEPAWDTIQNIYFDIPADRLEGVKKIYCAIFGETGNLFGSDDLFSSFRFATREGENNGYIRIVYNPYDNGIMIKSLNYVVYLYDENGNILNN